MTKKLSKAIMLRTKLRNQFLLNGHQKLKYKKQRKAKKRCVSSIRKLKGIITKTLT